MLGPREGTLVIDALFSHRDRFRNGECDEANMENKLTGPTGAPTDGLTLEAVLAHGLVPLGALVYPRYRVATLATSAVQYRSMS